MRTGILALAAAALVGCSSGIEDPAPVVTSSAPLGFDPAVSLADAPITRSELAAAYVPGGEGRPDRRIALVAFVSATAQTPVLVRDAERPADGNGASDVFLAAVENIDVMTPRGPMPTTFRQGLLNVFRHDRCVHCHALGDAPAPGLQDVFTLTTGDSIHPPAPVLNDPEGDGTNNCLDCHESPAVTGTDVIWFAPQPTLLPPGSDHSFDFRGKSVAELNQLAQSDPTGNSQGGGSAHLKSSRDIDWAIRSALVPGASPQTLAGSTTITRGLDVGRIPISFEDYSTLVDVWTANGFRADTDAAVRDLTLVSLSGTPGLLATANGASFAPAISYRPDPAYDPEAPYLGPAGTITVAFASSASDLVPGATVTGTDVYLARFELWLDSTPDGGGAYSPGAIDIRRAAGPTVLVSHADGSPSTGGNGVSTNPAIDADAGWVAYESTATDLCACTDANGASDVFLHRVDDGTNELVSRATDSATQAANGASLVASLAADGSAVAFESLGSDLVLGDTNGQKDVFWADVDAGTLGTIRRASVATGGAQAVGGASSAASIARRDGEVLVAFESTATGLDTVGAGVPPHVYVHRATGLGTTKMLSQRVGGTQPSGAGNGASRAPRISADGDFVVYQSDALNLEQVSESATTELVGGQEFAQVRNTDVFLARLETFLASGVAYFQTRRISEDLFGRGGRGLYVSTSPNTGLDSYADGDSTAPAFAVYRGPQGTHPEGGVALFRTLAWNLGTADNTDRVLVFVGEPAADPVVITQPLGSSLCAGAPATFTVSAVGDGLRYEWRKGGVPIPGAADLPSLTLASTTTADAGSYDVRVYNAAGSTVSATAVLQVAASVPEILEQPVGATVCADGGTVLAVSASGGVLSYEWRLNGVPIEDATASSYAIADMAAGDAGDYTVVVTNPCGTATSDVASIVLGAGVEITTPPQPKNVFVGDSVTFEVVAVGAPPLTYQWRRNGIAIPGANAPTYAPPLAGMPGAEDDDLFSVTVTGASCQTTSAGAKLNVAPTFDTIWATSLQGCSVSGCHVDQVGLPAAANLSLDTVETAYAETFNVVVDPSSGNACCWPRRILPGDANDSALFGCLTPGGTNVCRTPQGQSFPCTFPMRGSLSDEQIEQIGDYINALPPILPPPSPEDG